MKILIIRFSSIGDIVLTTPVVRALKQQRPDCEVHYLTKKSFYPVLEANPYIDQFHFLSDDIQELIESLKAEQFDYIADLHHNLRTLRVKRGLKKVRAASFNKLNIEKWLLTNFKVNTLPDVHIVDRYLETVKPLGIQPDGQGLDYFIPEKDRIKEEDLPVSHLAGYIGVVIGAAHATKQLPREKLRELCAGIEHPIILLGGAEDRAAGEFIAAADPVKIYNACGKFNLNESADLVRRAKLIVTHDTGLMHIAAAFQKPILVIWGNTVPSFGMYPYYGARSRQQFEQFEVAGLRCRPCSKIGHDACPKGHFKCMMQQDLQAIISRIEARL